MPRRRHSFARVLAETSVEEALPLHDPVGKDLGSYVELGIARLYDYFSVQTDRLNAAAAYVNRPANYPLTAPKGAKFQLPKQELERVVTVLGRYGPGKVFGEVVSDRESENPAPFRVGEFLAICNLYFHSRKYKWELGWMRLAVTEQGWHSTITNESEIRSFLSERGRELIFLSRRIEM